MAHDKCTFVFCINCKCWINFLSALCAIVAVLFQKKYERFSLQINFHFAVTER